jgi:hypothetical protein
VTQWPTHQRGIGLVFQDALLFPHMSVAENLLFAVPLGVPKPERQARVQQALQEADLAGMGPRDPSTLSGGQRARVALMRALLAEPKALLLDEPFSQLDAPLRAQLRPWVFAHVRERQIPVVLVTHDAQDIADPDWILQAALAPALQTMSDLGLVLDALIKPLHLQRLLTLAARYPALTLVIDHAAKPDISAGQWEPWASDLADVASQTQAVCKISGLLTEAGPQPGPDAAQRWAAHVLQVFGEGRVMWGSDWPVLELAGSYSAWWQASRRLSASLSEAGLYALYGGTARRIYKL